MKTWVKVYTEINRDPDIGTLTWAQRGIWTALLALAGEIDHRDQDEQETGKLDTIERVAWSIRCDIDELEGAIEAFRERGMIMDNGHGILGLPNYPKRQARPPSSRPSAVAERVKRHRAKGKDGCNVVTPSMKQGVTPSDTDPDTESDPEKIQRQRQRQTTEGNDADVAECLQAVLDLGIQEPTASKLVQGAGADDTLATLVSDLRDWIAHFKWEDKIRNPTGAAIRQVEARVAPPTRAGRTVAFLHDGPATDLPY